MRVFYHTTRGKRLNGVEFGQRLSFIDLLKLRDGDVILFDRISSYLCYFLQNVIRRRVVFIYYSDGMLSSLQKLGPASRLFEQSFFDGFIVNQPIVENIFGREATVINLCLGCEVVHVPFEGNSVIILLANDPFLGFENSCFVSFYEKTILALSKKGLDVQVCYGRRLDSRLKSVGDKLGVEFVQYLANCKSSDFIVTSASSSFLSNNEYAYCLMSENIAVGSFALLSYDPEFENYVRVSTESRHLDIEEISEIKIRKRSYRQHITFRALLTFLKDLALVFGLK